MDFESVESIRSPLDCLNFDTSFYTKVIIISGASCSALWNCTCLLLFYLRLRKLTKMMMRNQTTELTNSVRTNSHIDLSEITQLSTEKPKKPQKPDIVRKFLPIMLKLSILSLWCALSTFLLGLVLWTIYPTLSAVIDSTIGGICVYLSFHFNNHAYEVLCLRFIGCRVCDRVRKAVNKSNEMQTSDKIERSVLG